MSETGDPNQGGFTLIECVAVLAITALAGAIAFPGLERAGAAAWLAEFKQAIAADLREGRGRALASGRAQTFAISVDRGAYGWNGRADHRLPFDLRVATDVGGSPAFFPDGSATPGRLVLSASKRRVAVAVSATGVVSMDGAS